MAVYTTIDDPSAHHQTLIYTGNGSDDRNMTNDGNSDMQPDLVWIKCRGSAKGPNIYDSSRGTSAGLSCDNTNAEFSDGDRVQAFSSDGFQLGTDSNVNENTTTFVAWQWKANGGSTSSNTDGNVTVTLQANTTAGFSIGTWTSDGGTSGTIGHGLGARPDIVITKERDDTGNWNVIVPDYASNEMGKLQDTDAFGVASGINTVGSSTFKDGDGADSNDRVFYAWRSIQGYSKINVYTGNGNADGPFVYTGFKPAWLLTKQGDGADNWQLVDHKRDIDNIVENYLMPDSTQAETTHANNIKVDFLSNGFKCRGSNSVFNGDGNKYIYIAFAENPFVTSGGVPCTAR